AGCRGPVELARLGRVAESERPFSVTKVIAGVGGALLIAAFFLPLVDLKAAGAGGDPFGVQQLRKHIDQSRELAAVKPLIEPAVQSLELFAASPSLKNMSSVAAASRDVLEVA